MDNDHPICVWCGKPRANYEDWDTIGGGDGGHLCWEDPDLPEWSCDSVDLYDRVSGLCERIAELEKDKVRLDWLESVVVRGMDYHVDSRHIRGLWRVGEDLRAAIDAAKDGE